MVGRARRPPTRPTPLRYTQRVASPTRGVKQRIQFEIERCSVRSLNGSFGKHTEHLKHFLDAESLDPFGPGAQLLTPLFGPPNKIKKVNHEVDGVESPPRFPTTSLAMFTAFHNIDSVRRYLRFVHRVSRHDVCPE
jgi:hypothetical protein